MTVRRLAARDLEQVVRTNLERLEPLLFRTQLPGYEGERSGLNHWTETTEGTCNVLRTFREVDVSPVSPSSTTPGCVQSHPKTKNQTNTKRGKTK